MEGRQAICKEGGRGGEGRREGGREEGGEEEGRREGRRKRSLTSILFSYFSPLITRSTYT